MHAVHACASVRKQLAVRITTSHEFQALLMCFFCFVLDCTFEFIIYSLNSDQFYECNMHDTCLYLDDTEVYRLFAKPVDHSIKLL